MNLGVLMPEARFAFAPPASSPPPPPPSHLLLPVLHRDLALIREVRLVPNQHNNYIVPTLVPHVGYPLVCIEKGCPVGDVVDHNGNRGVADVGRDEGAEALLACSVPELEADGAI